MRRRAAQRRKGNRLEDALELFFDALCDTLGTIMFIMLVVVIFAKPAAETIESVVETISEALTTERQAAEAEQQAAELVQILAALPPAGDPVLIERWQKAVERMKEIAAQRDSVARELDEQIKRAEERERAVEALDEKVAQRRKVVEAMELAAKTPGEETQFVRMAHLHVDASKREPIVLLLAGGRLSRPTVNDSVNELAAPVAGGERIDSPGAAAAALLKLVPGANPSKVRLQIAVWEDSFGAYKHLERTMIDSRYAFNPMPVQGGMTIKRGMSGVQ